MPQLIDVYNVSVVTLKYYNNVFSHCDAPANYTGIMQTFGGVYKKPGAGSHALVPACLHMQRALLLGAALSPPVTDSKLKCQLLSWPGITFAFSMLDDFGSIHSHPSTTPPHHSSGFSSSPSAGQTHQDYTLPLKKVLVYCGESYQEAESPPIPSSCFHGNCYADCVNVFMQDSTAVRLNVSLLWTGE